MNLRNMLSWLTIAACAVSLIACASATREERWTGTGAAVGAGVGAILGQAIGADTQSTLLGAGLGAALGGIAGNRAGSYMDNQEREFREAMAGADVDARRREEAIRAEAESVVVQRTQDVLTATFRSEVLFDSDSAKLKPGAAPEIDRVAGILKKYHQTQIRIEGHTDARGSGTYNLKLSEKRAHAVKMALVHRGVDHGRIAAIGYGESRPISSEDAANRRVTVVILPPARG